MAKIITFFLLSISAGAFSQTVTDIHGAWQFESISDEIKADPRKKESASMLFSSMAYTFNKDNTYIAEIMGVTETGTWMLNGKEIVLNNGTKKSSVPIQSYGKGKLTLLLRDGFPIIFSKTAEAPALTGIAEQLALTWHLSGIASADGGEAAPIGKGNYLDLNPNGTYTMIMGNSKEEGTWSYNEAKKAITVTSKGNAKNWIVSAVTNTSLTLIMGSTGQRFVYTAQTK